MDIFEVLGLICYLLWSSINENIQTRMFSMFFGGCVNVTLMISAFFSFFFSETFRLWNYFLSDIISCVYSFSSFKATLLWMKLFFIVTRAKINYCSLFLIVVYFKYLSCFFSFFFLFMPIRWQLSEGSESKFVFYPSIF